MAEQDQPEHTGGAPQPVGGSSGGDSGAPAEPAKAAPKQSPPEEAPAAAKPAAPAAKPAPKAAAAKPAKKPAVMETSPWDDEFVRRLRQEFQDQISEFSTYLGQKFLVARPGIVVSLLAYLREDEEFDYLVDITAVDYPDRPERFEVVYILYSFARNERIRIKTRISDGEKLDSAVSVHLTADWLEREVYDMFGIEFDGHPDLKRILMPDGWEGFPLRKDKSILDMDNRWVQENLGIESGQ